MTPEVFIEKLHTAEQIDFEDTISMINANFDYTPTRFSNGLADTAVINEAGKNEGSCKIFAFAKLMALDEMTTLRCFGRFYHDVLNTPTENDHQNIRNFMKSGWAGIVFDSSALTKKRLLTESN